MKTKGKLTAGLLTFVFMVSSVHCTTTQNTTDQLTQLIDLLQGCSGRDGRDGRDGEGGEQGLPGPPGPMGIQGPPGRGGPGGLQGPQGRVGPQGLTGRIGNLGPRGLVGPPGHPGHRGVRGHRGPPGPMGVTYIRWGKSSCPNTAGNELVYAGRAGGSAYNKKGGGAERLCMPDDPDYITNSRSPTPSVVAILFMEQNMKQTMAHLIASMITMSPVLSAIPPLKPQ